MKTTRNLSLVLAILLCLALTACAGSPDPAGSVAPAGSSEPADTAAPSAETAETPVAPLQLTFFDKNTGDAFNNPVAQEIMRKTGVEIIIQQPTGDPEEKLSLMLTSGDLPDIVLMDRRSDIVKRYIAAGGLIALNDLIDAHGPDIKTMYGDVLEKSRHTDGKNYYLNNWYGVDPDPDRAVNIRMDVLKEFGYGERAEAGDFFTQDEYFDILTKAKEKYGAGNTGFYPLTLNGSQMVSVLSTFRGMYGMKGYYESPDGQLLLEVRDPKFLPMMQYFSKLNQNGLLDKEWVTNSDDLFKQKLINELAISHNGGIQSEANAAYRQESGDDTDKQFYMFRVVADGADPKQTTFSPRSSLGWDAIGITMKNEYPEETIKLFNFLVSEEGQYLLLWGVEGEHWDRVDGKHVPRPEIIPGFQADWGEYSKATGIRKWTWFIKNGYGSDGTPFDLVTKYEKDKVGAHAFTSMAGSVFDSAPFDNIGPQGGTPDALSEQKLKDILDQYYVKMVSAGSDAEVESIYNSMMSELEANNAAAIEKIYTENYQNQVKLWS